MNGTELRSIIEKGQSLLNLRFEERVTDRLVEYSNGLAAVCHQLALNCCNAVGVLETSKEQVEIGEEELDKALRLYVEEESDTTKALFDMAMKPVRDGKYDNRRVILTALATFSFTLGVTYGELLGRIHEKYPEYPAGNLSST